MNLWAGSFRCLGILALCLLACGCPNWNVRGRARVTAPPPSDAALNIQTPPQPSETKEKSSPVTQAAEPTPVQLPPVSLEKQEATAEMTKMRTLHSQAFQRVLTLDTYTARLKRREVVNGKKKQEEIVRLTFRKEPFSVHIQWLGTTGKEREVIYVKGRYDDKIHTRLAAGDVLLMPAGTRLSLAPDNPLVLANSRHPITEAGLGHFVDQFGALLDALEKGDTRFGTAKYMGLLKRPEIENQVEEVQQTIAPGNDPLLPKGGQRLWFFDVSQNLPVLIITKDESGQEVEFYCHDQIDYPVALDDDAFNPDKLWGKK